MVRITISIAKQRLNLEINSQSNEYTISTSRFGPGEKKNSFCTPRGRHIIRAKIGEGEARGQIFKDRRPTCDIYSPDSHNLQDGDWILTRILWLSGTQVGKNRLGNVDTMQRYIYLHGVPDDAILGIPRSMGCINMSNHDIEELFDLVEVGTPVAID